MRRNRDRRHERRPLASTRRLADAGIKVIDVILSVGYDDRAHFECAFRQTSGFCPRDSRAAVIEGHFETPAGGSSSGRSVRLARRSRAACTGSSSAR